jgi:galactokinase
MALPPSAVFVISNTLDESVKAVGAEKGYNLRVVEGKLAAKIVAKGLGLADWAGVKTFRGLQEALKLPSPGALLSSLERHLEKKTYSRADAEAALGVSAATVFEGDDKRAGALRVLDFYAPTVAVYDLLKRARHVCAEAERVLQFQAVCGGRDGLAGEAQLRALGKLLDDSHASCRDDYECSSPGLDEMTALARASGAIGSRLTGAGWGGCAVSLVARDALPAFLAALSAGYYAPRGKEAAVATALFASAPGAGAAIYAPAADDL